MAQIKCNFFSYSLGHGVDIEIILPSFTSCNMELEHTHNLPDKFPALYLLHGAGNDYMVWHKFTSIGRYAEEKRIAVITFSSGNKAYSNVGMGDNYYDFLNHELPEFVENYFPISNKARYIAGLSLGGYGALLHGLKNPERYGAIGAFSPAVFDSEHLKKHKRPNFPELCDIHELTRKAADSGKKLPDIFLCIGSDDFLYEPVLAYHKLLDEVWKESRLRFDNIEGYGHEFALWDIEVRDFLDWIERNDIYKEMGPNKV